MTIEEYKQEFADLMAKMEEEHGTCMSLNMDTEITYYGGILDKTTNSVVKHTWKLEF